MRDKINNAQSITRYNSPTLEGRDTSPFLSEIYEEMPQF